MLFALAKSYLTYYFLPFTYYFPKNPAILGKSEEVKSKNPALSCRIFWLGHRDSNPGNVRVRV